MRVDINLASHPYEDSGPLWLRWGGAVAALSLFTLILLYSALSGWVAAGKDRSLIEQRQQQIAARDQQKAKAEATLNLPANRGTRDRAQFLNDLFQRKAFSWTKVFEDLERVMPPRLHVVSIQPERPATTSCKSNWWWRENRATAPWSWCARWKVRNTSSRLKSSRNRPGPDRRPATTCNLISAPCTCLKSRPTRGGAH